MHAHNSNRMVCVPTNLARALPNGHANRTLHEASLASEASNKGQTRRNI